MAVNLALRIPIAKGVMKKNLSIVLQEQKGQALPIALAMMAIGSLILYPLLSLTNTSLKAGQREESRMYEHYAANAGIMDGIREIITDNPQLPAAGDNWTYSIPNTNNRIVNVTISTIDQNNWEITSTATSSNGENTELYCWVKRSIPAKAITSESITIRKDATINGDVQWDSNLGNLNNKGIINGEIIDAPIAWPAIEDVSAYYLDQVNGEPTHEGELTLVLGSETLADPYSLGPIYINGNLSIQANPEGAVRLDGTVYVDGCVDIDPNVSIYLNNNTLYSNQMGGVELASGSSVYEYGCIVSRHAIYFSPICDADAYIIAWSLGQPVILLTSGELNGAMFSGELSTPGEVEAQYGTVLTWAQPPPELLLPPFLNTGFRIVGWESSTH